MDLLGHKSCVSVGIVNNHDDTLFSAHSSSLNVLSFSDKADKAEAMFVRRAGIGWRIAPANTFTWYLVGVLFFPLSLDGQDSDVRRKGLNKSR